MDMDHFYVAIYHIKEGMEDMPRLMTVISCLLAALPYLSFLFPVVACYYLFQLDVWVQEKCEAISSSISQFKLSIDNSINQPLHNNSGRAQIPGEYPDEYPGDSINDELSKVKMQLEQAKQRERLMMKRLADTEEERKKEKERADLDGPKVETRNPQAATSTSSISPPLVIDDGRRVFHEWFPNGYERVSSVITGPLSGLNAIIDSIKDMIEILDITVPSSFDELIAIARSPTYEAHHKKYNVKCDQDADTNGGHYPHVEQIGAVLYLWGLSKRRNLRLGCIYRDERYELMPHPEGDGAKIVWIQDLNGKISSNDPVCSDDVYAGICRPPAPTPNPSSVKLVADRDHAIAERDRISTEKDNIIAEKNAELLRIKSAAQANEARVGQFESEKDNLLQTLETANRELAALREQNSSTNTERIAAVQEAGRVRSQLQSENDELKRGNLAQSSELQQLRSRVIDYERDLQQADAQKQQLEAHIASGTDSQAKQRCEQEIQRLVAEIQQLTAELSTLRSSNQAHAHQQQKVSELERDIRQERLRRAEAEGHKTKKAQECAELRRRADQLEKEKKQQAAAHEAQVRKLERAANEVLRARQQEQQMKEQNQRKASEDNKKLEDENKKLEDKIKSLEKQRDSVQDELNNHVQKHQDNEHEADYYKEEIKRLKEKTQAEIDELKADRDRSDQIAKNTRENMITAIDFLNAEKRVLNEALLAAQGGRPASQSTSQKRRPADDDEDDADSMNGGPTSDYGDDDDDDEDDNDNDNGDGGDNNNQPRPTSPPAARPERMILPVRRRLPQPARDPLAPTPQWGGVKPATPAKDSPPVKRARPSTEDDDDSDDSLFGPSMPDHDEDKDKEEEEKTEPLALGDVCTDEELAAALEAEMNLGDEGVGE